MDKLKYKDIIEKIRTMTRKSVQSSNPIKSVESEDGDGTEFKINCQMSESQIIKI